MPRVNFRHPKINAAVAIILLWPFLSFAGTGPTLFIAGDSTAAQYTDAPQQGWGARLQDYFDVTQLRVDNRARGGRSSRTFITEGHWQKLISDVQPGDLVLIQFGHNDASAINDDSRARGSLKGIGANSQVIDNQLTGETEEVFSYGHYLRQMIDDVRALKATPVVLSLTVRNIWDQGRIERGSSDYGYWAYQIALEKNTEFIDVTQQVADELERLGQESTASLYPKDHTHFNDAGAKLHAEAVVAGLKGMRPALVNESLSQQGKAVPANDWSFVRLPSRSNQAERALFLVGDSTVRNGTGIGADGQWGWGSFLGNYLALPEQVQVVNRAIGGFSSRTYVSRQQWQQTLNQMHPGDLVLLQFGHNDAAPINDKERARGTFKGTGNRQEDIINLLTGKPETVHTYGWYLREMVGDALSRGVTPILASPVPRKRWNEAQTSIQRPTDSYPQWAEDVATTAHISFIDFHEIIARQYDRLGPANVEQMFADEHTHTNKDGAIFNAELIASALNQSWAQIVIEPHPAIVQSAK